MTTITDEQMWGIEQTGLRLELVSLKRTRALASARWWRKHSLESANPKEALWYAENQELLANDMEANPLRYADASSSKTDWEIFKEATKA
ncbi:MAG TPA: hypothetical protein VFE27_22290 [Acidobacteriaceae bacterium]|nr:hypothetical protein [Acidobacteriaceae bacterium]